MFSELLSGAVRFFCFMLYIRVQNTFARPLSAEEERDCLEAAAAGDRNARDRLISHNLRLVAHVIKKYYTGEDEADDLLSIGTIGLIKAVDTFSASRGARFSTYAARCIENEVLMYFRSRRKNAQDVSINDVIDVDREGNELTLMDVIASDDAILDGVESRRRIERMYQSIDSALDMREKRIIVYRYGLNNALPKSQQETADLLGISRSYVSRIEKRALEKLRAAIGE